MKPNVVVIGCGYWGPALVRNFAELGYLHGICDAKEENVQKTLQKLREYRFNVNEYTIYNTVDDVLSDAQVSAVVIATPPSTHFEIASKAIRVDKHVFCEKPFVFNPQNAESLVETAKEKGLVLMVGHIFLYNPAVRWIKEFLGQNGIGDVYYTYSQRLNLGKVRNDVNALWNLAPHDLSIWNYLFNDVPETQYYQGISCLPRTKTPISDVDVFGVQYKNTGIVAHLHCSWVDREKVRRITLVGSSGAIVFDDMDPRNKITVYNKGLSFTEPESTFDFSTYQNVQYERGKSWSPEIVVSEEPMRSECRDFIECIQESREPVASGRSAVSISRVLHNAHPYED